MSVVTVRGGFPRPWRAAIDGTGQKRELPHDCLYLIIRVATAACKLYFRQEDFDADENYVLVPVASTTTPHGEWQGPVEAKEIWLKSSAASSAVELVTFQRRG